MAAVLDSIRKSVEDLLIGSGWGYLMSQTVISRSTRAQISVALGVACAIVLTGCAHTVASNTGEQHVASAFSIRNPLKTLAVLFGAEEKNDTQPLVNVISSLTPDGMTVAFARDIDINQPVSPPDASVSKEEALMALLHDSGLKTRIRGKLIYIERDTNAGAKELAAAGDAAVVDDVHSQLIHATMMSAPVLDDGEKNSPDPHPGAEPQPQAVAEPASQVTALASAASSPTEPVEAAPDTVVIETKTADAAVVPPVQDPVTASRPSGHRRTWQASSRTAATTVASPVAVPEEVASVPEQPDEAAPDTAVIETKTADAAVVPPVQDPVTESRPSGHRRTWQASSRPAATTVAPPVAVPEEVASVPAQPVETAVAIAAEDPVAVPPLDAAKLSLAASTRPLEDGQSVADAPAPVSAPEVPALVANIPSPSAGGQNDVSKAEPAKAAEVANASADLGALSGVASPAPSQPEAVAGASWHAERGQTLREVLQNWCQEADVQLVWSTDFDFPLSASITLDDGFENAVRTLLVGFSSVSPQPVGRLHRQGNAGQRVLIVETRGNIYEEQ